MPAPVAPFLESVMRTHLDKKMDQTHQSLNDFLKQLTLNTATAWGQWAPGLIAGFNTVSGAGIGAWVGTGSGGKLQETTPFLIQWTWPLVKDNWESLKIAIKDVMQMKFNAYASSFVFGVVPYAGTSGATPVSPGPIVAFNIPGPLVGYKTSGMNPSAIASLIRTKLPAEWAKNPEPLGSLLKAYESAVTQAFTQWEATSQFTGDQFIGVGSPGAGAGAGPSLGTGKIV